MCGLTRFIQKKWLQSLRDVLSQKNAGKTKHYFNENYQQACIELDELKSKIIRQAITNAPHKKMIVTHAAFGYWEKRYGIEQISISGLVNYQ